MNVLSSGADFRLPARFIRVQRFIRRAWRGLREWCGDTAYERYLDSKGRRGAGPITLTREEYYVEQLNRRYSRPSRCC